jgi:hypothetical protein
MTAHANRNFKLSIVKRMKILFHGEGVVKRFTSRRGKFFDDVG